MTIAIHTAKIKTIKNKDTQAERGSNSTHEYEVIKSGCCNAQNRGFYNIFLHYVQMRTNKE